ncbi:hypothetical protein [Methylorubrum extorquens]|uniref:Uncharacterized protein n=1 Tax=Methylorubrum extorquens DSM 13060 TaxID=882800 RepID=H1KGA4_METEX|nr:hypothetical protein [Methylorubrum extorquens]EHP93445.1 hypothetical protein MetexDRAFT_1666 [Methylorubrum extorquens DSM 13060]
MHDDGLRRITVHFRDEAERDQFLRIHPEKEGSEESVAAGIRLVEQLIVPPLMRGEMGLTREEIHRAADPLMRAALREARRGRMDRDLVWCWRLAFTGRLTQAIDTFLGAVAVIEEASEALDLLAAGLKKATSAMDRAAILAPAPPLPLPRPAPLPGLGAPRPRPLRPEDFGAMPNPPRH